MHLGAVPRTIGTKTGLLALRFEAFTQSAVEASRVVIARHFASVTVRQYWSSKLDLASKVLRCSLLKIPDSACYGPLHLGQVPPAAMEVSAAVVEDDFEDAAPGAREGLIAHRDNLARHRGLLALLKVADLAELASVFVAAWRVEQQIAHSENAPFCQQACPRCTHPGHRRHRRFQAGLDRLSIRGGLFFHAIPPVKLGYHPDPVQPRTYSRPHDNEARIERLVEVFSSKCLKFKKSMILKID